MEDMSIVSDNLTNSCSKHIEYLNNCIREVCLNDDTLSKYEKIINKYFPNEPNLFKQLETIVNNILELASQQKQTQTSISNIKYLARDAYISEQTIDYIFDTLAEKKRQQKEETARKHQEDEARRKREEEEIARKLQEEEAAKRLKEQEYMSKFSRGACGLTFIWGYKFGDKLTYFAPLVFFLLFFISIKLAFVALCIFMVWVGWNARKRVWKSNNQMMPPNFMESQKKWDIIGLIFFVVTLLLALLG